jgi:hypothetical protein
MSKFIQAACKVTGVKQTLSTAYHPRTDRQSERSNQWLETAIQFITDQKQKNWAPYLPIAQFAHNNWPSDTTRKSPFFLLMGFNPHTDWIHATSPIPRVNLRLEQLKEARVQARDAMIKAQQSWVKHRDTPKYKEGDQVWLEGKNLRINQPTAKLAPRRHGPFKIIQVMSVTDLQGPPSERTPEQKLWDFKTRAQQYARDRESCDDVRISYLEFLETEAEDDLALARMIAG